MYAFIRHHPTRAFSRRWDGPGRRTGATAGCTVEIAGAKNSALKLMAANQTQGLLVQGGAGQVVGWLPFRAAIEAQAGR